MGILVDSGQHRVVCAGRAIAQPARKSGSLRHNSGMPQGIPFPWPDRPHGVGWVSPGGSRPATCGRFRTNRSEVLESGDKYSKIHGMEVF
jgi:hypothetical protein